MDEIPVAKREVDPEKKGLQLSSSIVFICAGSLLLIVAAWFVWNNNLSAKQDNKNNDDQVVVKQTPPQEGTDTIDPSTNNDEKNPDSNLALNPDNSEPTETIPENILGHLPYEQSPQDQLKAVTGDGRILLRKKAADKFLQMQADARRQGIILSAISGFRTVSEQEYLFFEIKAQRAQDASKRAEVSAPPGYSEHHTGYAIDIGDGNVPSTNLSTSFEQTKAFKWLMQNAPRYSFELSFPKDNLQGISYEPWHWRYVGDTHSLETFYKVRNLDTNLRQP